MPYSDAAPTLTDGAVTIRAHRPEDAAGSLEQCLDPLSRAWTTVPLDYTYADAQRFVTQAMPGGWADDSEWGFVVEAVDHGSGEATPRYAGTISLRNEGSGRAEVAYGSHPWVRGRGVMERALRLLLRWGFEQRDLRTVIWWANRGNWASRKLAWRLGFTVEGELRQWLPQRGELLDGWVGTLLAGDPMEPRTPWLDVPRIGGDRVVLRRHEDGDEERIVAMCQDDQSWGWVASIPHPYGPQDARRFLASREEGHASGTEVSWAVADPVTDVLLGNVGLFRITPGHEAEVGYVLHPDARGRGVATEACRLAVRHALLPENVGGLGLERVCATAAEGNLASRRVLVRAGLTEQGRGRRALRTGHGLADAVVFDVLPGDLPPG